MPYRPHSAYPSPYESHLPVKKRPSWAWFVLGGLLMLVAVAIAGFTFGRLGWYIAKDDAVFAARGNHTVTVPPHTQRGIFVVEGAAVPRCQVTDGSGATVQFTRPDTRFTFDQWEVVGLFDTGDGTLTFHCHRSGGQLRIGRVPSDHELGHAVVVGFVVPLVMGGLGFVIVLVTLIVWFRRRSQPTYAGPPPLGWQQPPPPGWPPAQ
jgi:hypothetical protein